MSEVYPGMTHKDTHACTHAHTHMRTHRLPLLAAIRRRVADKNITGPIRQLNRETQQSVLAA